MNVIIRCILNFFLLLTLIDPASANELIRAAQSCDYHAVKTQLENGADINATAADGTTAEP